MGKRPACLAVLIFIGGLLAGHDFDLSLQIPLIALALAVVAVPLFFQSTAGSNRLGATVLLGLGLLAGGFLRHEVATSHFPPNHVSNWTGLREKVAVEGWVADDPELRPGRMRFTVETQRLIVGEDSLSIAGKILVSAHLDGSKKNEKEIGARLESLRVAYGNRVRIHGRLRTPRGERNPGELDYKSYLAARGVFGIMYVSKPEALHVFHEKHGAWLFREVIYPLRHLIIQGIDRTLPGPEGALLKGLLVGQRSDISPDVMEAFARTGIIHILAVSGLNVAYVVLIFQPLVRLLRLRRGLEVLLLLVAIALYALLTNREAPVVRASIMAAVWLIAQARERRGDPYNTLAVAALVILLWNPLELFQIGFQLSFAAIFAIVYCAEQFQKAKKAWPPLDALQFRVLGHDSLALAVMTLAAQLGTLPVTAYYFHRVSVISVVPNLVIVPLMEFVLALGFTSTAFEILWKPLANIYANANWLLLKFSLALTDWLSRLPFASVNVPRPSGLTLLLILMGVLLGVNSWRPRVRRWLIVYLLAAANLIVWPEALGTDRRWLKVTYFDVGQGDAALVTLPTGRHILIDAGDRSELFDAGERIIAPYLRREGIRTLDAIVVSHPHDDHLGGVPYLLRHFRVRQVMDSGLGVDSKVWRDYTALVDSLRILHRVLRPGEALKDFDNVGLFVLRATDKIPATAPRERNVNNESVVIQMTYGEHRFLFTGDVQREVEATLLRWRDFLRSDVLKVGHHGSSTSSIPEFLDRVRPSYAVISVGESNPFRHPSPQVIQRLRRLGTTVVRTDRQGAAVFRSDGQVLERLR